MWLRCDGALGTLGALRVFSVLGAHDIQCVMITLNDHDNGPSGQLLGSGFAVRVGSARLE